jgi:Calcineurin-like phosphoesterase
VRPAPISQEPRRHKMVGWYDPGQLINTGLQVLISQIFGARADYRLIEGFGGAEPVHDFSQQPECWFDYVADLGDGWNSTYAIASLLASERLSVRDTAGASVSTPRGMFLIMGGDQVYPVASRDQYEERTVAPYMSALPAASPPQPVLFAIPGNHDWYDGLISFMRLFGRTRSIGGWQTRQKRSYFAIRLPQNWWIWALDYQLESDIDQPQLEFFNQVADQMPPGGRVILVSAEPDWIYGHVYHEKYRKNIEDLQTNIINQRAHATLKVAIAGDLHHYRRHAEGDGSGVQLITSGGGGAFLLGTSGPKVDEVEFGDPSRQFKLQSEFPGRKTSMRLLLRNLEFPLINPKFGLLTGTLYLVIAWTYRVPVLREYEALLKRSDPVSNTSIIVRTLLSSPFGFGVLALVVIGFVAFTDTHVRAYKYMAGTAHAVANLSAMFVVSAAAAKLGRDVLRLPDGSIRFLLVSAALIFLGGYLASAIIMGIYLYISQAVFRRHSQEAFSSLRIADYKNFVRFHVDESGVLSIYPVGLKRVPRNWQRTSSSSGPEYEPAGRERLEPRLIEPVVRVR